MTDNPIIANAFASTFAFLPTHNAMQKKAKELACQRTGHSGHQCKLDTNALRMERKAADNSGFKKLAVQWLIEHSTSHQHLWWLDSFVLRNRQLLKPTKR